MKQILISGFVLFSGYSMADTTLTVRVNGIKSVQGSLYIAIYNQENGWLKDEGSYKQTVIPVTDVAHTVKYELPNGQYAVQTFQDVNSNGKLDMRWLPPGPSEPWGVSNNRTDRLGPPRYSDAVFTLSQATDLEITLVE